MSSLFKNIVYISLASLIISGCNNSKNIMLTITFDALEGEFSDGSHIKTIEVKKHSKLEAPETPTRTGYDCGNKWYYGENEWDFSHDKFTSSITLVTKWDANTYVLSVSSEDTSKGTVLGDGSYAYDSAVTVTAVPEEHYAFVGWYNESNKVSSDTSYTFNMPANDYSLVGKFKLDTAVYGLYPQTRVSDSSLISALESLTSSAIDENGYYTYNEELYYPYIANPSESDFKFEDGSDIVNDTKYWFKVEPIEWKILNEDDGFVTTSRILDTHIFNERYKGLQTRTDYQGSSSEAYPNNYKYSQVRSWLNVDFYNRAFFNNDSKIKITEIDNSVTTTAYDTNDYVCENTNDKVFLLSYRELLDASLGFSSHDSRKCKPTDFALARGTRFDISCDSGVYFTRSPDNSDSNLIFSVFRVGSVSYDGVNDNAGIRPALKLNLN